jgi:hypothetical protein
METEIRKDRFGDYCVYQWKPYERWSVLAPGSRWLMVDHFATLEEAQKTYPGAEVGDSGHVPVQMSPEWFDPTAAGEVWHEEDY